MKSSCVTLLGLLLGAGAARADFTLTTADLRQVERVSVHEFSLKDGLSYSAADGTLVRKPARDVLALGQRVVDPGSPNWLLRLRNGDQVRGTPSQADERGITMDTSELGSVIVPLKHVASLAFRNAKLPKADAMRDVLQLGNGDSVRGDFMGIKPEGIVVQTQSASATIPLANVQAVVMAGVTPARGIPALAARFTTRSGTMLTTGEFTWRLNEVQLKDPSGRDVKVAAGQITSAEILGGRTVYLTEIDPARDEQVPFLGGKWPTLINRNVAGGPLQVARTTYARGLGVHTKSTLVYELDGSFETLTLRVGLDDSAVPYGEADVAVVLDGKTLWEKKALKAGQISEPLNLPIKGGKKLELRAAPGDRLDVQGRVDWLEPALSRP